jgi:hypothetical protein
MTQPQQVRTSTGHGSRPPTEDRLFSLDVARNPAELADFEAA